MVRRGLAFHALPNVDPPAPGAMSACIWCSDHHFSQIDRVTYDLGQRDSKSKLVRSTSRALARPAADLLVPQTALQAYVRNNKSAFTSADTFPLLRQARRLDTLIESVLTPPPPPPRAPSRELALSFQQRARF